MSSLIHLAKPTVWPVAIIIFMWRLFCDILKNVDGRTDGNMWKIMITTSWDCGLAEWINKSIILLYWILAIFQQSALYKKQMWKWWS